MPPANMRAAHIDADDPVGAAATISSSGQRRRNQRRRDRAVGMHYAYDAEHDQFAHPAAAYVVDAGGRVAPRAVRPRARRRRSAARPRRRRPRRGRHVRRSHPPALLRLRSGRAASIPNASPLLLEIAAGATLLAMAGGMLAMLARERRRRRHDPRPIHHRSLRLCGERRSAVLPACRSFRASSCCLSAR